MAEKECTAMKFIKVLLRSNDSTTGITIHFVNSDYDKGKNNFTKSIKVDSKDTE